MILPLPTPTIVTPRAKIQSMMFAGGIKEILNQEMVKDRDKLVQKISDLEKKLGRVNASAGASTNHNRVGPIETTYRQWDTFEDIDELEASIVAAKESLSRLNNKIKSYNGNDIEKPCDHRYRCSCSGNKSAERQVVAMKTSERLDQMSDFKKEGNELFAQKKYRDSLNLYEKSLIYYEYCFDGDKEEKQLVESLRLQCLLNAAACFLKLKMYAKCIEYCNEALEIDNTSTKAWFRLARAHRLTDKFEAAKANLAKAMESLDSDNSLLKCDIQRELKLLQACKRRK